jgi:uncharacterized membrane protein YraQ (UPF0718 family)
MEKLNSVVFEIWNVIASMSLYLLFGFLIAGILHVIMPVSFIEKHLAGKSIGASIKAALIGVPLPLCSCGVIPVSASLRKKGAGKGAVLSFLTSTPQTGVDSILVTYVMLGGVFTLFRVIIAFLTGIICGVVAVWLTGDKSVKDESLSVEDSCCSQDSKKTDDSCCGNASKDKKNSFTEIFRYGFVEMPEDLSHTLIIGLLIAGILGGALPDGFFAKFADNQFLSMAIMVVVGIPLYVCSTASVPVAAAFIKTGISPGAALVFLILGPATNAATITTISKSLGKKSVVIYLLTISLCAICAGIALNYYVNLSNAVKSSCMTAHSIRWYEHMAAVVLLLILLYPAVVKLKRSFSGDSKKECC